MRAIFTHAITRKPGENFAHGITTSQSGKLNYNLMLEQHGAYVKAIKSLSLELVVLEPLGDCPDAYFVEDTAVVLPEVAILTNPGAVSRKGEVEAIHPVLARFRKIARIMSPGTVDGGDVLIVGKRFFIGISDRTNREGIEQLGRIIGEYGYSWTPVLVDTGLHLKSSVNYVGKNTLLVTEEFATLRYFQGCDQIVLGENESYSANTLWINDCLITPKGFPKTVKKLEALGMPIIELDISEARKMDGGLTCMSLRF